MATEVNQKGYDVVSAEGQRISVKTATMGSTGHVTFNPRSFEHVDRVIVLRVNTEEMQVETLLDASAAEAADLMGQEAEGKRVLSFSRLTRKSRPRGEIRAVNEVTFDGYRVRELESGTIEVERDGVQIIPAKPALRELAMRLNIGLLNSNGNPMNTRQLGSQIIKSVCELQAPEALPPSV